jgi:hypothetical protein
MGTMMPIIWAGHCAHCLDMRYPYNVLLVQTRLKLVWAALMQSSGTKRQRMPDIDTVVLVHKQLLSLNSLQ